MKNRKYLSLLLCLCFLFVASNGIYAQQILKTDSFELRIEKDFLKVIQDGKTNTYSNGSEEYAYWIDKFSTIEAKQKFRDQEESPRDQMEQTRDHRESSLEHMERARDHQEGMSEHQERIHEHEESLRDHFEEARDKFKTDRDYFEEARDEKETQRDHFEVMRDRIESLQEEIERVREKKKISAIVK